MNENEIITTVPEDDDVFLPEGWGENDDIFNVDGWTGGQGDASAAEQQPAEGAGEEAAPATEQTIPGEKAPAEGAPATERPSEPVPNKLKFRARVDRQDLDVELDESQLPEMYEKAQATDRYKQKLERMSGHYEELVSTAKANGYDDPSAFLANMREGLKRAEVRRLVGDGVHEEVAEDMAARKYPEPVKAAAQQQPQQQQSPARDFSAEVRQLKSVYPDVLKAPIPKAVIEAATSKENPKNLLAAYNEYMLGQYKAEAESFRKENEILKQNAAAAAKAPVSGATGGGVAESKPDDDFIKGFDSF